MRSPHYGKWPMDDDPADLRPKGRACPGGVGWDLRNGIPPWEEEPVVTYRLNPEEVVAKYGPPKKRRRHGHGKRVSDESEIMMERKGLE